MPELSLGDAHRCGRQADPPCAHRGLGRRLDRHLGRDPRRVRALRAGAGRLLREAVRRQRHVGAVGWALGWAGRGRHVRPVDPQLHPAVQGTRAHRLDGGGQGPQERAQEPLRAPAPQGHLDREGEGVPDAVGPAALPRVVPVVRRRGGGRARQRGRGQEGARGRRRGSSPTRSAPSSASSPDATRSSRRRASTAREELYKKAGITNPLKQVDCAELYVPFSWYEPMWLEGHLIADEGEGWKMTDARRHRDRRRVPRQHVGRRAVVEPDRRLRASSAASRRPTRCGAPRATTRSTGPRWRSATPTAARRSTSPCGSSALSSSPTFT